MKSEISLDRSRLQLDSALFSEPKSRFMKKTDPNLESFFSAIAESCVVFKNISVQDGDAGDAVASPKLKNCPLLGQKFSKFGQCIQRHSHVSEVMSVFQTKAR